MMLGAEAPFSLLVVPVGHGLGQISLRLGHSARLLFFLAHHGLFGFLDRLSSNLLGLGFLGLGRGRRSRLRSDTWS